MPLIDTLRLKTDLVGAGLDEKPAAAIAEALGRADTGQLATKEDLQAVKAELYRALWIQWAATMTGIGVLLTYLK
ncbi:MAG: hypothetical protein OXF97_08585 [Nitrospira sp.]|nr:hypothetical protein [Nitrospira sp.]MCY3956633.1 hypothetical protein [Nitrospira sp.]MCY4132540.1 hypothetical protein [Nitrospira sp.]MDE0403842.1 hypothetical protein [Nitrospira sp.]MDE0487225.1 hypothetical protein [Nitrospira sp.]